MNRWLNLKKAFAMQKQKNTVKQILESTKTPVKQDKESIFRHYKVLCVNRE